MTTRISDEQRRWRLAHRHRLFAGGRTDEIAAITDDLWARGYTNEDLAKIYGGNKMRVYQQVWEGVSPEQHMEDLEDRIKLREDLRKRFMSR